MNKLIDKLLEILRKQVNQNNEEIRLNQDEINRISSDTLYPGKQQALTNKYQTHRELMDENSELINFQLVISEFMEKYGRLFEDISLSSDISNEEDENSENDSLPYFKQTISGRIKFDQNHPQFNNPGFFNHLLKFYEEKEDYEMCLKLMKIIKDQHS